METAKSQIFFSYAREDGEFALKLAMSLRSSGANLWIDQLDIPAGADWDKAVEQALKIAEFVLIILSPVAVESTNVMNEVSFALEHGKRVVPVLYKACEMPLQLYRKQRIDFTGDFNLGLERLLHDFNIKPPSSGTPKPPKPIPSEPPEPRTAGEEPGEPPSPVPPGPSEPDKIRFWLIGVAVVAVLAIVVVWAMWSPRESPKPTGTEPPAKPSAPTAPTSPSKKPSTPTAPTSPPTPVSPIPKPQLTFTGTRLYSDAGGRQCREYELAIANWAAFQSELFQASPDLPPCGANTNASRTWVSICDATNNSAIYSLCGLSSPESLNSFSFGVCSGQTPPESVYVLLIDRRKNTTYRSNTIMIK